MNEKKPLIITHSGNFHADDVLAVAALDILVGGDYILIRTRDPEVVKTGDYVVDVGGEYDPARNRFDHHQEGGAGLRDNDIPYSSLGLVWETYGEKICGSSGAARIVDGRLCVPIDAADNGVETVHLAREDIVPYGMHSITGVF